MVDFLAAGACNGASSLGQGYPVRQRSDAPAPRKTTRDRILEAAILRFAQYSYEETRLRDIADDVGIDAALVHRSFGSKERLFAEVVDAAFQPQHLFSTNRAALTGRLTARALEPSLDQATRLVDPLDIIIRSLLSPEAIPILRAAFMRDIVGPLAPRLDDPSRQRAALLAAFLAGIGIFRNVLRVKPLLDAADEELEPLIAGIIRTIIGEQPATPAKAPRARKRAASRRGSGPARAATAGPA